MFQVYTLNGELVTDPALGPSPSHCWEQNTTLEVRKHTRSGNKILHNYIVACFTKHFVKKASYYQMLCSYIVMQPKNNFIPDLVCFRTSSVVFCSKQWEGEEPGAEALPNSPCMTSLLIS